MMSPLKRTLATTPLLLALAAPAAAQQPTNPKEAAGKTAASKVSLIAQGPLFVAHVDGPEKLRTRFLATNMGKLFASNEFKDLLKPMMTALEQMKKQAATRMPLDLDELEKAIKGYSGRLTMAVHVVGEVDVHSSNPPFGFTVVLSPDGVTDLKGLCEKCVKLVEEDADEKAFDLEVEGTVFRSMSKSGGYEDGMWAATVPFIHAGHAVMCLSTNLKESVKMVLNPDQKPRFEPSPQLVAGSLGVRIDTARIVSLVEKALKSKHGEDYGGSPAKVVLDMLGVRSLDSISGSWQPMGPYVTSHTAVQFNSADRGVLAAVFPKGKDRSPFLDSLPRTTSMAQTFHFDMGVLYASAKKIWQALDDTDANLPMSWADIETSFEEQFGFRLKEDFVDHLGACGIVAQQISQEPDEDFDTFEDPDGTCLAFQVKNPEPFNKCIDTMLRKWGQHAARKEEDYKGQKVYRLTPFGMGSEVHYAVADRLFLIGLGMQGGPVLRAVLDAERDTKEGKEPAPLSSGLKARLRSVQPGYLELGWVNVPANLKVVARMESQIEMAMMMAGVMMELPDEVRTLFKMLDKMRPMLKTYNVDEQLSLMRAEGNKLIYQTIW